MQVYDNFWEKLIDAYPVSHGKMRLPIVSEPIALSRNIRTQLDGIQVLLDDFISTISEEVGFAQSQIMYNQDNHILSLLSGEYTGVIRVDCLLNGEGRLKIVEINADYPDGLFMHDYTYTALSSSLPNRLHAYQMSQLLSDNKSDLTYILYPEDAFFLDAYYLAHRELHDMGYNVQIGAGKDLTKDGRNIVRGNTVVKNIYRCKETRKFLDEDLIFFHDVDVQFVNSFDIRVVGYKNVLSIKKSEYIPSTFDLTNEALQEIIGHKDKYVIKPTNMFEGKGVYIGKDCSEVNWNEFAHEGLKSRYIVQEYIETSKMKVKLFEDGGIVEKELYFDLCPHYFIKKGKVVGRGHTLMRFSQQKILNVAMGGALGYMLEE